MPLRKKIKQGFKGLFQIKSARDDSDKDTTRPTTPSSTHQHTTAPEIAEDSDTRSEIPPPAQTSATSRSKGPALDDASDGDVHLEGPSHTSERAEHNRQGDPGSKSGALGKDAQKPVAPLTGKSLKVVASGLVASAVDTLKFGPIKDVSDMLQGCADMYIMEGTVKKEYEALEQRLQRLLKPLEGRLDESMSPEITSKIEDVRNFIKGQLKTLGLKQVGTTPRRLAMAKDEEDRFLACCQQIQGYLDQLLVDNTISTWIIGEQQSKDRVSSLVGRLPFSASARYNSSAGADLKRRECTPSTRIDVLDTLLRWARNNTSSGVYWLNGMAGTGKTTIAYSVCKELDAGRNLAASFFCSRLQGECRDVSLIIPSIAYQLARVSRPFQSALSAVIEDDPDVHTMQLDLQFKALIEKPVLSAKPTLPEGLIVVIDALDECDNKQSTRDILRVLLNETTDLPIKFIVSSRPEPQIRDQMAEQLVNSRLVLHELDTGSVQADIKTYLKDELKSMKPPPTDVQIAALVERAGILFIYAATVVRYIGFGNFRRNPAGRLRTVLDGSQGKSTSENQEIDGLYSTILEAAFSELGLENDDKIDMQHILHTVVCAREPLTINGLSELLQMHDVDRVRAALDPMWSVLHVVETSELVTTLHASFPDFMFDPARSKTYYCDLQGFNSKLAEHCFERIKGTQPEFNICGLPSSYLPDEQVPDIEKRVDDAIPSELVYACRYWADHVKTGNCAVNVVKYLRDLLSTKLLLWMEVLNLKKQLKTGVECMKLMVEWRRALEGEQGLMELAQDAKRFVEAFASNPVSRSTPHIYVSMLAFWPRSSPIFKHYAKYTRGPVKPEGTALDQRQLAHLSTWEFEFETSLREMVISPDGWSLAAMTHSDIVVIDSSSGRKLLEPLPCSSFLAGSLSFSADGARIVSGTGKYGSTISILVWDTRSGETLLGPPKLRGHTGDIVGITFSPDGTCIATSSYDGTIRLWDAENGQILRQADIYAPRVVFSPDGTRIIAGPPSNTWHTWDLQAAETSPVPLTSIGEVDGATFFSDGSRIITYNLLNVAQMNVWDAQSSERVLGPIEVHGGRITCIGCSPDGRYIVSGSNDPTVCVWDSRNGNIVLGPLQAHKRTITSVIFTSDSSRIISAGEDGLVCTWDAQQRNPKLSSTTAPFHDVTCVKFSSDGTCFVSGSEKGTISIWDAQTGERRVGPVEAHTSRINEVDFVNDRVVSGAYDGTICICDAVNGEIVVGPLQLDVAGIFAIAYSPDGQMIATGSDGGVDVWNAKNGNRVLGPLIDLKDKVVSVQFSGDSTRIVAGYWASSSNIAVWDVSTGRTVFGALEGYGEFPSVSYSPNGALIASGSDDGAIIVWDAYTGEKRIGLFTAHSSDVNSVHFSPDSTRLVSGSNDWTIRIWDVETGEMVFELLSGHEGGISSVEYSPDSTHILSRSAWDESVRIHDARSPAERAQSRADSEIGDWTINKDGWVVDDQSRLLVWVPGDLRKALMLSGTRVMLAPQGYLRLEFDKSRMGEWWAEGYTSRM